MITQPDLSPHQPASSSSNADRLEAKEESETVRRMRRRCSLLMVGLLFSIRNIVLAVRCLVVITLLIRRLPIEYNERTCLIGEWPAVRGAERQQLELTEALTCKKQDSAGSAGPPVGHSRQRILCTDLTQGGFYIQSILILRTSNDPRCPPFADVPAIGVPHMPRKWRTARRF